MLRLIGDGKPENSFKRYELTPVSARAFEHIIDTNKMIAYTKPSSAIDGSEWVRCDFGRGSSELAERNGIKIVSKADFTFLGGVLMRLSQSFFLLRRGAFPISLCPLLAEDLQASFPLFVG